MAISQVKEGATVTMDKSAETHRIVINASAQAVWDAITLPEWTEKYGYGGRVEYELKPGGNPGRRHSQGL